MPKPEKVITKSLIEDLGISEEFTTPLKKEKLFSSVKANVPLVKHYNYMVDVLFLPKEKKGYRYLLVVCDLATDQFDIEPMKDKESETIVKALKAMYKRSYIKEPEASIKTDAGNEFEGAFSKYLFKENILHSIARPRRHKLLANVESLNRQLGR